ncbi:MAG: UDP-N-acetylmuramoyl-tripeptide--D-alanyl-D-alanine ligase [Actinomycetota bacterium]|jgi:UDP-N-acetylmuramoyl-tripeptide--D-alanyl-D-alanine ligase|nr:UDP-N-acetylmuramoyl-tripeptide--D-alanyl-D-alanine ligase [Actinomycetota bacterium]
MGRADPFTHYSTVLRIVIYGLIPAFGVLQFFRLRRALHVFQLEGYKRARFLEWCKRNKDRALFMRAATTKKPLVMTGRAWRILVTATLGSVLLVFGAMMSAHLAGGFPYDLTTWAVATAAVFYFTPRVLVLADVVMSPIQTLVNRKYLRAATAKLAHISPTVIGVTGSFGKTSTKFAIQSLLGPPDEVLATPGSFNTPLGVCRTINEQLESSNRFFIVEMGAYGVGEIAELCRFVHPSIGVLTAIGPAHLERFGSMDAIRKAKYEIVESLPDDGVAVMNVDDPVVRELADGTERVRVVRYGLDPDGRPDVTAREVKVSEQGTELTIAVGDRTLRATTRLLGRHSIGHVLAGVAVAVEAGRPLDGLPDAIAALEPVEHRLQIIKGAGGVTVIDDAYNSNPDGAAAALEVLEAIPAKRRVVVTPGIIELGPLQAESNERFGAHAARVADALVVVARVNRDAIVAGARSVEGAEVITVDSLDDATEELKRLLRPGDVVLFENDLPDQYEG